MKTMNQRNKIARKIVGSDGVSRTYWVNPEDLSNDTTVSSSLSSKSVRAKKNPRGLSDQLDQDQINDILDSMDDAQRSSADADDYRTALCEHLAKEKPAFASDINDKDVLDQISNSIQEGGGTIRSDGSIPQYGFCYSPYPEHSVAIPVDEVRPADMLRYMKEKENLLNEDGNCVGIWHNKKEDGGDGKVYFDISCVTHSAEDARQKCKDSDQIAFFDMNRFEEVTVDRNASSGGAAH